ncbi:MAG: pyridoxal-dependent decarboxylase, partial [Clostridiales bacterium]|nr:pyridoxal-dependent decarboxylase [Clostridiales bacterium]
MERKTPYYVIDQKSLDDNFEKLERALKKHWSNFIIGYSYKTNALPWIIRHFDRLGCYAEVVSEEEYRLAKLVGVKKGNLIYNGPIKTKETFLEAIRDGCIVNIDSEREIDWLDELPRKNRVIGIRVNFDIERMCPGQSQCPEGGGRFGFCYENGEFSRAVTMLQEKGARVSGLHLHTSSKSRGLDIYRAIARVACDIQKEFRLDLDYV